MRAQNPNTEEWFDLPEDTQTHDIVSDPNSGEMFEVISVSDGVATLQPVDVGEDWGE